MAYSSPDYFRKVSFGSRPTIPCWNCVHLACGQGSFAAEQKKEDYSYRVGDGLNPSGTSGCWSTRLCLFTGRSRCKLRQLNTSSVLGAALTSYGNCPDALTPKIGGGLRS